MKTFFPTILIVVAAGLFIAYTNPQYQEVKILQAQVASYDQALTQSSQLRAARDTLLSKRNTFSTDDVRKLERILPDNVDNIRLIIDIDNIAARHGLQIKNVALGASSASDSANQPAAVGQQDGVGVVELGFTVSASYDKFLDFLTDLEQSLRIVDVEEMRFSTSAGDQTAFSLRIKTYWLR